MTSFLDLIARKIDTKINCSVKTLSPEYLIVIPPAYGPLVQLIMYTT